MKIKQWIARSGWLYGGAAIVIYAVLLPWVADFVQGGLQQFVYSSEFLRQNSGGLFGAILHTAMVAVASAIRLGGALALAWLALGRGALCLSRGRALGCLLGAAFLYEGISDAIGACWLPLYNATGSESVTFMAEHLTNPIRDSLALCALLLLIRTLLCHGEEGASGRLHWSRTAVVLLVVCVAVFILQSELTVAVTAAQREMIEQQRQAAGENSRQLYLSIFALPQGLGGNGEYFFAAMRSLLNVALCYSMAGGSWVRHARQQPEYTGEPVPMTEREAEGKKTLGKLVVAWLCCDLFMRIGATIILGNGLGLDIFCLLLCEGYFLYRGRRWARGWWCYGQFVYLSMCAMLLWLDMRDASVRLAGFLAYLPVTVVSLRVTHLLFFKTNPVRDYLEHCRANPATPEQQKWDRRFRLLFWFVVIFTVVTIAAIAALWGI